GASRSGAFSLSDSLASDSHRALWVATAAPIPLPSACGGHRVSLSDRSDGVLPQTGDLPPATRQAQSGALPGSAVAMQPYWSCRQPALQPNRTSLPAEPGVCPPAWAGEASGRDASWGMRTRGIPLLHPPLEERRDIPSRYPCAAACRVRTPAPGLGPCRLQFLVHLLEKGDATGN